MAVFGSSFLDLFMDLVKKKYKLILFILGLILGSTLFVIYENERINSQKEQFTQYIINIQTLEEKEDYISAQKILDKMANMNFLTHHQKLLIEFYNNKINLILNKPTQWKMNYISRTNLFKDPKYNEGFLHHIWEKTNNFVFPGSYVDESFSCLGELSLIMELDSKPSSSFIMDHKAQSLPNYLLWYINMKNLYRNKDYLNARLHLMQIVSYSSDYSPYELFKSGFRNLLLSLRPIE